MKDHRFIELLNLYIDRQISAEETAELETELQHNPKRQAVYRRYCEIHTATKLVYDSFRTGANDQPEVASGRSATVELFENRRRRANWNYYAAGLVAAACLTVVFMRNGANLGSAHDTFASTASATGAALPVKQVVETPVAAVEVKETVPNLISLRNTAARPDYSAMLAALREQDEERALAGERWQATRVSLFDDNVFDANRSVTLPVARPQPRASSSQQAEFTAFQFQR